MSVKDRLPIKDDEKELLQLAHHSVKEYLISIERLPNTEREPDNNFHRSIQRTNATITLAKVCLTYLLHLNFEISTEEMVENFPLAQYCSSYWIAFAAQVAVDKSGVLQVLIKQFFCQNNHSYRNCYKLHLPDRPWASHLDIQKVEPAQALYFASFAGFSNIVEFLIDNGADINCRGGLYGNALCVALENGQDEIVDLLISKEVDAKVQYDGYETALCIASRKGQDKAVGQLLDAGAEINARNEHYGSALCVAAYNGHAKIIKQLLARGADVNSYSQCYGSALCAAACNGHYDIANMLIENGADVNLQGGDYGNALSAAIASGHDQICELLLSNGASDETDDGELDDGLGSESSDEEANTPASHVNRLLWDADLRCERYGYELSMQSLNGNDEMVELLLNQGIKLNIKEQSPDVVDEHHCNALKAATQNNHCKVARLLLEKGARIRTEYDDVYLQSLLNLLRSRNEFADLLLEHATSFGASERLSTLVKENQTKLAKLALSPDANPNIVSSFDMETMLGDGLGDIV
ncbi:Ankyrin-2 [Dactylella cylindrospora]|nr:Ankyrin-2 [Dactylella cylindrospora]